ncbi:polycystin family receptor for egg jelly-like isoform X1 [Oryctolagus cuniculus]|uniref:polycystin family receptor for egg jelly-like isoform X1 n=1 Tax=Oryctolagus cuniculus TaxID=9986 RepID=UPI003879117A
MRAGPAVLLLSLGLGLGLGGLPPAPAPAPRQSSTAGPGWPAPPCGHFHGGALRGRHARLSLPRLPAPGGGALLSRSRGLCFSCAPRRAAAPGWYRLSVRVRRRTRRCLPGLAAPPPVALHLAAPGGRLALAWFLLLPLPLRRPLGPLAWTFQLGLLGPGDARPARHAARAQRLKPRSVLPALPRAHTGFVAQTRYPTDGPVPVVLQAVNSSSQVIVQSSCPMDFCVIYQVRINRDAGVTAVRLTRNEGDTLNATINMDCPSYRSMDQRWLVFSVLAEGDVPDWNQPLDVPQLPIGSRPTIIHIPPASLSWGVYLFNFSVTITTLYPIMSRIRDSDSIYIWILRSPLVAVLGGDANITSNYKDEVILDGSMSSDPEENIKLQGLRFIWYCTTNKKNYARDRIQVASKDVCHPDQADLRWPQASNPVLTLSPGTLQGGREYFFRMAIQKGGRRAFSDKTVNVLQGPPPLAHISCIENCGSNLIVSDRFSLYLNCTDCVSSDFYNWSIVSESGAEMPLDWMGQTVTGRNGAYLSAKAFAFSHCLEANYWVSVQVTSWGGKTLEFKHPIILNHGPQTGECTVKPAKGIAFVTKFVVRCSNFTDKHTPLTYKMIVSDLEGIAEISSVKENTLGPILHFGRDFTTPPSFLPVGVSADGYKLRIFVQVYDSLGAFSQVTLGATVEPPTSKNSSKMVLDQLLNSTMGPNSSLSVLLRDQKFLSSGYLMYVVGSVLNSMKTESTLQGDKARLREHLVNQSSVLPVSTLEEINQVVVTVTKLTQKASEFTRTAQKSATVRMWQANKGLQEYRRKDKHFSCEQIEIIGSGILTSLSNILKQIAPHKVVEDPFHLAESLADTILACMVPGNKTAMKSASINMFLEKAEKQNVTQVFRNKKDCPNCFQATLNGSTVPGLPAKAVVSTMFCEFADDPFPWLHHPEKISTQVVGFRMYGAAENGDAIEITPSVVDVYLNRKNLTFAAFNLTVGPEEVSESSKKTTGGFSFEVDHREVTEVLVHIVTEVTVLFKVLVYAGSRVTPTGLVTTFLVPYDIPPIANQSDQFDPDCAVKEARVICLPVSLLQVIAQHSQSPTCAIIMMLEAPRFVQKPNNKLVKIFLFSAHCLGMYQIQSDWREDYCSLGERTTWQRVHCVCKKMGRIKRHLRISELAKTDLHTHYLTSNVTVFPNPVDLWLKTTKNRKHQVDLDKVAPRMHPVMSEESAYWDDRLNKWHVHETAEEGSKKPVKLASHEKTKTQTEPTSKRKPARPKASAKATLKSVSRHVTEETKDAKVHPANKNFSNKNVAENEDVYTGATSSEEEEQLEKKPQMVLPPWCLYIAWFLVFATSSISAFFIIFYGLNYSYNKSIEWLFASFCSFLMSVFVEQPCKIILVSGLRTMWPKYCKNIPWSTKYRYIQLLLPSTRMNPDERKKLHEHIVKIQGSRMYQPLTEDEIRIFQRKKRIKRRAFLFLSYILIHFIFLVLLLLLIVLLRHTDSFYYNQFIRDRFSVDLASVTKLEDIYRWLESVLVPLFHNDQNPTFLLDSSSKILGLPLMRQVRAKSGEKMCLPTANFVQNSNIKEIRCRPQYGVDPEDTKNYSSFWNEVTKRQTGKNTTGFTYKPQGKRWVYYSYGLLHTYGGGGYVFYFFPSEQLFNSTVRLRELQGSSWLDEKTWAVVLELTTFNPDVNLFCSISVLFEVSQLGVVNTSISMHSFSLADFDRKTSTEIYLYVAILIFFLAYIIDEFYVIIQERASYVQSVYNLLNLALKCIFTVLIVLFLRKHFLATAVTQFYLSNPEDFIPFHAVSQVDHTMRITLAFLLFLTILKTLRYSRAFYDVRLAQKAIQIALPGIFHMAFVVSIYFFVYMAFGYLVFGQHEWNYNHLIHATQTIFSYCVSAFQNTEFSHNRVLGVLFLSSFMLVMICILINLFQAVILSAYEEMKQPVYEEPSDEVEAMTYLCRRLRTMCGLMTPKSTAKDEPEFFSDMLYGQPEKKSQRYLGLKTRNITGKKKVYLVI